MKTTIHQLAVQIELDGIWHDLDTFDCDNRYTPTKEQRSRINAFKYENEGCRVLKRRIVVNEEVI